jgi:hypothetical protein
MKAAMRHNGQVNSCKQLQQGGTERMGLTVHLYRFEDPEKDHAVVEAYNQRTEELMGEEHHPDGKKWEDMTEAERATFWEQVKIKAADIARELGMQQTRYGRWAPAGEMKVELDSKKYPEHLFKIGYFRSSDNDDGLEKYLGELIGKSPLQTIFDPKDDGEFQPDWVAAKKIVQSFIKRFDEVFKNGTFCAFYIHPDPLLVKTMTGVDSDALPGGENEARELLKKHLSEHKKLLGEHTADTNEVFEYGSSEGYFNFNPEPVKVRAIIPGRDVSNQIGFYVIYEGIDMDWYRQALEIVEETIDYVLAQPDPHKFYLCWLG